MQQQAKVEIVEYDKKYATGEEIGKIFYKNYKQHANIANFTGVYHSMIFKYGNILTHIIFLLTTLIPAGLLFFASRFLLSSVDCTTALVASLAIGVALCYVVFAQRIPRKCDQGHSEFGKGVLQPKLLDINS